MKYLKNALCAALIFVMLVSLTGCGTSRLDHKKLAQFLDKQDIDECEDLDDFTKIYGKMKKGSEGFISVDGKEAQKVYNKIFNRLNQYSKYDITYATAAYIYDSDGLNYLFMFTFEDEKDAEKFYKKLNKQIDNPDDEGEEKGLSFTLSNQKKSTKKSYITGIYLEKNTVLYLRGTTSDEDFADDLCAEFKIPSPFDA